MMFVDFFLYVDLFCGVYYKDENMYVIGYWYVLKRYFVFKFNMNGEVEEIFEINIECRNINYIIFY